MSHVARILALVAAAVALVFAAATPGARAVITEPLPPEIPLAPPPIPGLPHADDTPPPAGAISDPIESGAVCGDWYLQSSYGGRWPTGSTWWEYQCSYEYPRCLGYCNLDWGPYTWIDYFYWDGSNPVFYGEFFADSYFDSMYVASGCSYWWDGPTSNWYLIQCPVEEPANETPIARVAFSCAGLSCSFDGSGSSDSDGTIVMYEWVFGDGTAATGIAVEHTYAEPGTYTATLTVTDDRGAWSRDSKMVAFTAPNAAPTADFSFSCSGASCAFDGSGSKDSDGTIVSYEWVFGDGTTASGVSVERAYAQPGTYTVTLTVTDDSGDSASASTYVTVTNAAPIAAFAVRCSGLGCSFDAGGSFDRDGTIKDYSWDFGDGSGGSGKLVEHAYAQPRTYTVTLTVTDNAGATATDAKTFNPISLSARGYKLNGLQKVDLAWSGPSGTSFDVYRNGTRIATVQTAAYTDDLNKKGTGSYRYRVCAVATAVCSHEAAVTF